MFNLCKRLQTLGVFKSWLCNRSESLSQFRCACSDNVSRLRLWGGAIPLFTVVTDSRVCCHMHQSVSTRAIYVTSRRYSISLWQNLMFSHKTSFQGKLRVESRWHQLPTDRKAYESMKFRIKNAECTEFRATMLYIVDHIIEKHHSNSILHCVNTDHFGEWI